MSCGGWQLLEELLAKREADSNQSLPVQVHAIQTHPEAWVFEVCSKDSTPKAKSKCQQQEESKARVHAWAKEYNKRRKSNQNHDNANARGSSQWIRWYSRHGLLTCPSSHLSVIKSQNLSCESAHQRQEERYWGILSSISVCFTCHGDMTVWGKARYLFNVLDKRVGKFLYGRGVMEANSTSSSIHELSVTTQSMR